MGFAVFFYLYITSYLGIHLYIDSSHKRCLLSLGETKLKDWFFILSRLLRLKKAGKGWAWWLVPVIPALSETDCLSLKWSWSLKTAGQHSEILSLLKLKNKISWVWWHTPVYPAICYLGGWGRRITWTQEAEVAVSWDPAIAFQPEWQSDSVSKINNKKANIK